MLQIQKKFLINEKVKSKLLEGAKLLETVTYSDSYFDTKDFQLVLKDTWLRKRDDSFELKTPAHAPWSRLKGESEQYDTLNNDETIADRLGLKLIDSLEHTLQDFGYHVFADYENRRSRYINDNFTIDIDKTDFGYIAAEVKLEVSREENLASVKRKLDGFINSYQINSVPLWAKPILFLEKNNQELYIDITKKINK